MSGINTFFDEIHGTLDFQPIKTSKIHGCFRNSTLRVGTPVAETTKVISNRRATLMMVSPEPREHFTGSANPGLDRDHTFALCAG